MKHALHAEWTKLRTSPGNPALLAAIVAGTVAIGAAAYSGDPARPVSSLIGVQLGQAIVAILAVQAVGPEFLAVSLAAVPRRVRLLTAKAVVLAVVVAVAAGVAVVGCRFVGDVSVRPAFGTVLYLILIGLLSLGLAVAVRNSAAAIGVVLTLLYAVPLVTAMIIDPGWQKRLQQINPVSAGLAIQNTTGDGVIGPWKGLGVLALWTLGALLAGAAALRRQDV